MVSEKATSYVHRLSELLLRTEVTDRQGRLLALEAGIDNALDLIVSARSTSRKVMLVGNGGSAAIVSHMQNDLCKAVRVRAMVFNEAPLLTALTNDHGYGCVFERPVELWADNGDLLLAVSSSGQSENILRAVRASVKSRCQVITFSGFSTENPLRQTGDVNFYVPSQSYGYVEVAHSALAHLLTDCASMSPLERKSSTD
jgi:D-sedoheptulose 7-phosphate isomerase